LTGKIYLVGAGREILSCLR